VYITRDVTERKQTEQQLADAIMQLQELSYVDSLTQVANRRSFDERLRSMWDLHRRDGKELSLLLIDIDCFKQYNDHYGHQQGDEALRACAKLISQSSKRGSDIVARYGGEEFAILLPNTSSAGGEQIAVNLLAQFKQAKIAHATSFVSEHLSVSVGLATMVPEVEQDYGDLVGAADRCLYQAKHDGRARYALTANVELQLPF
jgi:diguanylate cyclase (GGDEF)-like protein